MVAALVSKKLSIIVSSAIAVLRLQHASAINLAIV